MLCTKMAPTPSLTTADYSSVLLANDTNPAIPGRSCTG